MSQGAAARSRPWRRRAGWLGAGVGAAALAVVALGFAVRDDDAGVSAGSSGGWTAVAPSEAAVFTRGGEVFVTQIAVWKGDLLVLGDRRSPAGEQEVGAWRSDDGVDWTYAPLVLPDTAGSGRPVGCHTADGVAVGGDVVAVACKIYDEGESGGSVVAVALTRDLERWQLRELSQPGAFFGVTAAMGDDGWVVVALAADDPNRVEGSTLRVWTSSDLSSWDEIDGTTPEVLMNGQVTQVRMIGDSIMLVGAHDTYSGGELIQTQPALWRSTAGAPFERFVLAGAQRAGDGRAFDVMEVEHGLAVVGTVARDGVNRAAGWVGTPAAGFVPSRVQDPPSAPPVAFTSIVTLQGGGLLATASHLAGNRGLAWRSIDGGRSWAFVGDGPSIAAVLGDRPVGTSGSPDPIVWAWEERSR